MLAWEVVFSDDFSVKIMEQERKSWSGWYLELRGSFEGLIFRQPAHVRQLFKACAP